jgi:hypothetical protein
MTARFPGIGICTSIKKTNGGVKLVSWDQISVWTLTMHCKVMVQTISDNEINFNKQQDLSFLS